ncbi:hypothetical protein JTE90_003777 [Oedothorax gibbosus]|uniref:Uncharacterized protein n=1 Tax=Oedothorax gibbosus TaxID=931172 RepID=A0AAV6V966_9ARAC|nr:hypothetical protein JTE90_003777 [Oedothorax gibbosus]
MSRMRDKHPGAKLFSAAVKELSSTTNHMKNKIRTPTPEIPRFANRKEPSKQIDILKEPVLMLPKSSDSLDSETPRLQEVDDNYQKYALPDEPPDDEDYSLPMTQVSPPPGFDMFQSTAIDSQYHPAANRLGHTENHNVCRPPGFATDLSEYHGYLSQDCLPHVASAHPCSSSAVEYEVCNSSPQYYQNIPQRVETSSVSVCHPHGFSSVYSRPLPYDQDPYVKPVASAVLEHHSSSENESLSLSPQYQQGVSQRSYPSDTSIYHTPRCSTDPSELADSSLTQHLSHSRNTGSQYHQIVNQRLESAEVSPYNSPSSAMFNSEYSTSQYQSQYLVSELCNVQRQRSQSNASVCERVEPSGESSNYSAIVSKENSYYPSQYQARPQSSEFLDVSRQRSQSCVDPLPRVSQRCGPSNVYSFTIIDIDKNPGNDLELATQGVQDLSVDYSPPMKVQEGSLDSGCLSAEEENSNETSLKDYLLPTSYLPERTHELSANQTWNESLPEVISPCREGNSESVISGRVNRRNVSRIQGSRSSLSNSSRPTQNICIARRSLPTPMPQYISRDISDDSGAEVSTEDEADNGKRYAYDSCTGCEEESQRLIQADSSRQCRRLLPDYTRIKFLSLESDPGFIDSHCHLDFLFQRLGFEKSYSDYRLLNSSTYPVSYEGCVAVFCNPNTFYRKTMWQKYLNEEGVWGTFGCHPHNANLYSDVIENDLCRALEHSKVRALGEIGLDYSNRNDCPKKLQHLVLRRQLKIALDKKLPLVIHCRNANEDLMQIMKEMLPKNYFIHLHCFTDDWDWAQKWMSAFPNLFIGITNLVTYNSAEPTHDVAKRIPLDRLLLETDAPYFVPRRVPRSTKYSHPGMAIHVAAQIATLRNTSLKEIIHHTRENTKKMYRI